MTGVILSVRVSAVTGHDRSNHSRPKVFRNGNGGPFNNTFCLLGVRPSYSQGIKFLAKRRAGEIHSVIRNFWLAYLAVPPRSVPAGGHGMVEILVAAEHDC